MLRVTCDGTTLSLQGHAGAAPDLVCAAVTGLVYALAQRLTELEREGAFEKPPVLKLEPGDAQITALPTADYNREVQEDFRLLETGLRLLEQHYPEQIKVN